MIKVTHIRQATTDEWKSAWDFCSYSCFSHSPAWVDLWSSYYQGKINADCQLITFNDDKTGVFILTKKSFGKGLINVHESSVQHGYGGIISSDSLEKSHFRAAEKYLITKYPTLFWRINPFSPTDLTERQHSSLEDFTYAVDLTLPSGDIESQFTKKKIATKARAGKRKGLRLSPLQEDDINHYLAIYNDAITRWQSDGKSVHRYSDDLFFEMFSIKECDFWGVWLDDDLVCAGPLLKSKTHVVSWLALAKTEALPLKPYEFFYYHLIHHYKKEGLQWFDFNPSGGNSGVDKFKERFATNILPCPVIQKRSLLYRGLTLFK